MVISCGSFLCIRCPKKWAFDPNHIFLGHQLIYDSDVNLEYFIDYNVKQSLIILVNICNYHELLSVQRKCVMGQRHNFWDTHYWDSEGVPAGWE